jgi:hypothetical protein
MKYKKLSEEFFEYIFGKLLWGGMFFFHKDKPRIRKSAGS